MSNKHTTKTLSARGKVLLAKREAKIKAGWMKDQKGFLTVAPVKKEV